MARREWERPELIVLVRSSPEEAVLLVCKVEATPVTQVLGPTSNANKSCVVPDSCATACQSRGGGAS